MFTLTADDFPEFYREITGYAPYPWQERLCTSILSTGTWPDLLHIYTGGGKSAASLIHTFARAALGQGYPPRMVSVVPLRTLVDSQHEAAVRLASRLEHPTEGTVTFKVAANLRGLRADTDGVPLIVEFRRGAMGSERNREWLRDPLACTILTMTRDMAMSALLFHGYATSRRARPVEAGILAHGTVMVFDEAHTARQSISAARNVRESILTRGTDIAVPALQVVGATATPAPGQEDASVITWDEFDVMHPAQADVILSPKTLTFHESTMSAKELADLVLEVAKSHGRPAGGSTVTIVCNTVKTALDVADALHRVKKTGVTVLTGRMRPHDRSSKIYRDIATLANSAEVDILVTTQAAEIGIDADWSALVTELAPASALTQRIGRTNRRGRWPDAQIHVVNYTAKFPYRHEDLDAAQKWLRTFEDGRVGPHWVHRGEIPVPALVRVDSPKPSERVTDLLTRVEWTDAMKWSESTSRSGVDDDVELWLADTIDVQPQIQVALRWDVPDSSPGHRGAILAAVPVQADETWQLPIAQIRPLLKWVIEQAEVSSVTAVTCLKPGEPPVEIPFDPEAEPLVGVGDTVVIWGTDFPMALTRWGTLYFPGDKSMDATGAPKTREATPVPLSDLRNSPVLAVPAGDTDRGYEILQVLSTMAPESLEEGYVPPMAPKRIKFDRLAAVEELFTPEEIDRFTGRTVTLPPPENGGYAWMVVGGAPTTPEEQAQILAPDRVALNDHSEAVAVAARNLAIKIGLSGNLVRVFELAGRYHDAGKVDSRFQREILRNTDPTPLAKSTFRAPMIGQGNLPVGWRHEQLSAALAHNALDGEEERDLVALLCGMSHGQGRVAFPHGFTTLVGDEGHDATDLFTDGTWDRMVHAAGVRFGPWGLALLDALLRSADHTISARGGK